MYAKFIKKIIYKYLKKLNYLKIFDFDRIHENRRDTSNKLNAKSSYFCVEDHLLKRKTINRSRQTNRKLKLICFVT